ncbi:hypothetical protein M427DRAFT_59066 [Gonapodya prolifera JEL478]|uniref:Galactose oxidase n=1 Tax=Gonapodya prolifera (strain JEL478) TaxID=1344416 RepID=A0A139A913_GONPJ|nr:hypothetical protein M427DRAFT_59066 [Gonapodya prolifera JEL478]|eukprot:KXS12955.1 hypothetical protein M427DRAFT_59066 [Gonapodya prolifera JEL478]
MGGRMWGGGGQYAADNGIFAFDMATEKWTFEKGLGAVPKPKSYASLVAHYTGIYYFAGGTHWRNHQPPSLHHYDPTSHRWTELDGPESHLPSKHHVGTIEGSGVTAVGPYLFAFGGWVDGSAESDFLYCFDTRSRRWSVPEILNHTVHIVDEEYSNPYIEEGSPEAWAGGRIVMRKDVPTPRSAHGFHYCSIGDHLLLFCGEKTRSPSGRTGHGTYHSDVWALEIVEMDTTVHETPFQPTLEKDFDSLFLSDPVKVMWKPIYITRDCDPIKPCAWFGSAAWEHGGGIALFGGWDGVHTFDEVWTLTKV